MEIPKKFDKPKNSYSVGYNDCYDAMVKYVIETLGEIEGLTLCGRRNIYDELEVLKRRLIEARIG